MALMSDTQPRRDASAWPSHAIPSSVLVALAALGGGIAATVLGGQPLLCAVALLTGSTAGAGLLVFGMRRWLSGGVVPAWLGLVGVALVAAAACTGLVGGPAVAIAFGGGLMGGMFLANVWAVRAASANAEG